MKKIVILGLIVTAFFVGKSFLGMQGSILDRDGEKVFTNGDNEMIATNLGDFTTNLRLFGLQETPAVNIGPMAFLTHIFMATPMTTSSEIFDKLGCEKDAVDQASMIQVLILDQKIKNKVSNLNINDRLCVQIEGTSLKLKKSIYKGEEMTGMQATSGKFRNDPNKMILINALDKVNCN